MGLTSILDKIQENKLSCLMNNLLKKEEIEVVRLVKTMYKEQNIRIELVSVKKMQLDAIWEIV